MFIKRIIAVLISIGIVSCSWLIGGNGMHITSVKADEYLYTLTNDRLIVDFDSKTGLCAVTDKITSKTWHQYYSIPPQNQNAYSIDFDDVIWDIGSAQKVTENSEEALRINADANTESKVMMKFPAQAITPSSYKLKIQYKIKDAKDVKFIANFHFEKDGYGFLKTNVYEISSAVDIGDSDEWQNYETNIPISEFPAYANSFLVYFIVQGGPEAAGSVIIGKSSLIGIEDESAYPVITEAKIKDSMISFKINNYERQQAELDPLSAEIFISTERNDEVVFNIKAQADDIYYQSLNYPGTFVSEDKELHWMLPKDAGLYLPAYDFENKTNRAYGGGEFYAHMGFNMAFFGAVNDENGDGYYVIIDSPALTKVSYLVCATSPGNSAYAPQLSQIPTKDRWTKDRAIRIRFVDKGGYVGIAKKYREVASEKGYLVTLKEKAKTNPNILKSAGASRIDLAIDITEIGLFFEKLAEADIKNVMVKLGGSRNNGKYIDISDLKTYGILDELQEKYSDYYLYEYECYRDLFEQDGEFKADPVYVKLAAPYKVKNVNGMVISGWRDITGLSAKIICPAFGRKYLDYKMLKYPLVDYPFKARMFDILATTSLSEGECYDENHLSNRLTCMDLRLDLVKYSAEEYKLDNHTEGAAEYLIPYVNSGEGPLDIMANTGVGINSMNVAPPDRIPLWELVYHDCFGIYYHWEHGLFASNPDMAGDDLYSLLYGERGMFLPYYQDNPFFEGGVIDQMIKRIKRIDEVTQRVKLDEMLSHSFISEDGLVQKTTFESGVEVIVNFSDETYEYNDGKVTVSNNTEKNTSSIQTVYTRKQANGILILPRNELVIIGDQTNNTRYLKSWIISGILFVFLVIISEIGVFTFMKRRKKSKNPGTDKS